MKFLPLPREKRRLLDPLGRTALTCLLTAGSFGGLCAPLPLALTAAAGPGLPGLCCVLGCGAGAFLFLPFQAGLRQLAAAILIFSGSIAFYDTRLFARRAFRPGLAAALLLLVQSAYLIARSAQLWGLCGFCMAAAAAGTDLLLRRRDRLPLLLAVGVCLAAGRVSLSGVSPGMCLAAALLIRSVRELEPVRAAAWGAAVGLCMGLLGDAPDPAPMAVLSLSCAALSRVRPAPVPVRIGTFCAVGAGCVLLLGMEEPLYRVIELASGGILSLLPLPRLTPAAEKRSPSRKSGPCRTASPSLPPPCGTCTTAFSGAPPRKSRKIPLCCLTGRRSRCAAGVFCGIPAGGRITAPPTTPSMTPVPSCCGGVRRCPGIFPCISPPAASI